MRLLLSGILFVLALAFLVVSFPALLRGGATPRRVTLGEALRGELPIAKDLELEGVLVRTCTAGNLRADGRYLLPLVAEADALALETSGALPPNPPTGRFRAVIAELDFEDVAGKSLRWNETEPGAARLGSYRLSGLVREPRSWSDAAALHLEATTGHTPAEVLCIRQGDNSFQRAAAGTGVGMGIVFAVIGVLLLRSRARARRHAEPATGGFAWGGAAAAVVGIAVTAARFADNAGKVVATHGDEAGRALARAADTGTVAAKAKVEDKALETVLGVVDGVDTGRTVLELVELLRGPEPLRASVRILGGVEQYRRGPEGAYHLTSAEIRRSWTRDPAAAKDLRVASPTRLTPRRELGEQVWISLEATQTDPLLARVTDTFVTLRKEPLPQEFTLELELLRGTRDDFASAGNADLAVAAASVKSFGERQAQLLRTALERRLVSAKPPVTVEVVPVAAFPAHFHLRGEDLEVEVGALRLDVELRPVAARLR